MNFSGKVIDKKLQIHNKKAFDEFVASLNDYRVSISVEKIKAVRSIDQNKLYWVYLQQIAEDTGDNPNDLHELFKRKFLPPIHKTIMGEVVKLPNTTTKLNKIEFGEYMDRICAETGYQIPDKNNLEVS